MDRREYFRLPRRLLFDGPLVHVGNRGRRTNDFGEQWDPACGCAPVTWLPVEGLLEDLAVQEFITQLRVEALAVAVLPRRSRFDVQRFRSRILEPLAQLLGHEPRTIL